MASSVQEKHIKKLREAGYLAKKIDHRLPTAGQIVPTPEPQERVVFLPHFVCGLGFPLDPFVRDIMYYYGIDFHDISPNSFLNISTFIVVCEDFLRFLPHFGLLLKIFNVKPNVVSGQHAECGVAWATGSFNDSVKEWQQQWFYITEPCGTEWAVAPEFRSGAPLWLTSWPKKGLDNPQV